MVLLLPLTEKEVSQADTKLIEEISPGNIYLILHDRYESINTWTVRKWSNISAEIHLNMTMHRFEGAQETPFVGA